MSAPESKRDWAARLYLMAGDAYERGHAKLAEVLIARANQYADEAVAQAVQQQQQPQPKKE